MGTKRIPMQALQKLCTKSRIYKFVLSLLDFSSSEGTIKKMIPKAASESVLLIKVFLKISQNWEDNTCVRFSFLIKLQASAQFLRTPFFQNPCGWLLLWYLNWYFWNWQQPNSFINSHPMFLYCNLFSRLKRCW